MENKANEVYLILGTNLGKKADNLLQAQNAIEEKIGRIQKRSAIYETEPWGISDQPTFYNQVVRVDSSLSAAELLDQIQIIEHTMGRVRKERYGARLIDIDILFFNNEVYTSESLTIPHPRIAERNFVLAPLAEIAPDFVHPVLQQSVSTLLQGCTDPLLATKLIGC